MERLQISVFINLEFYQINLQENHNLHEAIDLQIKILLLMQK